eukprot:gi/632935014/ref/XP_007887387.1/ PREDICTED: uncharacterized protein LOC103175903 isoform X1 [Callorhinchus milii]
MLYKLSEDDSQSSFNGIGAGLVFSLLIGEYHNMLFSAKHKMLYLPIRRSIWEERLQKVNVPFLSSGICYCKDQSKRPISVLGLWDSQHIQLQQWQTLTSRPRAEIRGLQIHFHLPQLSKMLKGAKLDHSHRILHLKQPEPDTITAYFS